MNEALDFQKLLTGTRESAAYAEESALLEFTEELVRRMEHDGVSRAELARRLGCSPAHVTQILRGPSNFTLASMARISQALGCTLRMRMQPEGAKAHWFEVMAGRNPLQGVYASSRDLSAVRRQYAPCATATPTKETDRDRVALAS